MDEYLFLRKLLIHPKRSWIQFLKGLFTEASLYYNNDRKIISMFLVTINVEQLTDLINM